MRRRIWIIGLALLSATGCSSMNHTEKDALGGAAAGAGVMALATRGNPVAAAVGGLAGGLIGGSIGAGEDRREARDKYVQGQVAAQAARQMSLNEVVQLAQQGNSDAIIINQINATGSVFALTADDINFLHQQRVSDQVIATMQARRYRYVAVPPPAYVVEPAPIAVGVGIGYGRRW